MSRLVLATLIVLASACGPGVTTRVIDDADRDSWLGRTRDQLVTAWGEPARTRPDGEGGTILEYTEVHRHRAWAPLEPTDLPKDANPIGFGTGVSGEAVEAKVLAEFRLDPDGRIYHYRIDPELLNDRSLELGP